MSEQSGGKKRVRPPYLVRPSTAVLTRGFEPRVALGAARPAVFRAATYVFESPEAAERAFEVTLGKAEADRGEDLALIYARLSHPNAEILEDQVVPLEPGAQAAAVFNSGMAAISTLFLTQLPPGSSCVYTTPLYGGTQHLIHQLLEPLGVRFIPVAAGDTAGLIREIGAAESLRLVFIETPSNPTLRMSDIKAAVEAVAALLAQSGASGMPAGSAGAAASATSTGPVGSPEAPEAQPHESTPLVAVDNTFLGPAFQHPLALGADLALYSATKFLNGFSDLIAGVVLGRDPEVIARMRGMRAILGNILQPDECWLLNGRLPTVTLRMNRQSKSAQRIAEAVAHHPAVERINYPSLFQDEEQIRIRDAQCSYPGSVFSLELSGGKRAAFAFLRRLRIVHDAVSLGGVESLACHPASTTHSELSLEERQAAGVGDGLVRVSIGIEDWRDLLADLTQALDGALDETLDGPAALAAA